VLLFQSVELALSFEASRRSRPRMKRLELDSASWALRAKAKDLRMDSFSASGSAEVAVPGARRSRPSSSVWNDHPWIWRSRRTRRTAAHWSVGTRSTRALRIRTANDGGRRPRRLPRARARLPHDCLSLAAGRGGRGRPCSRVRDEAGSGVEGQRRRVSERPACWRREGRSTSWPRLRCQIVSGEPLKPDRSGGAMSDQQTIAPIPRHRGS
jgi:hypothetical protein